MILQVRRCDAGDDGDLRANQRRVDRHTPNGHFQHPEFCRLGHARQVPGNAVGQVGVGFGLAHVAPGFQRLGKHRHHSGLAETAGHAKHCSTEVLPGVAAHLQHGLAGVGNLQYRQPTAQVGVGSTHRKADGRRSGLAWAQRCADCASLGPTRLGWRLRIRCGLKNCMEGVSPVARQPGGGGVAHVPWVTCARVSAFQA